MKKTYKIEVDCANCANKMEDAARKTEGVKEVTALTPPPSWSGWQPRAKRWRKTAKSSCNS